MKWRGPGCLLAASHFISSVCSAGTTVSVTVSYCPATATSLATGPGVPSGTTIPAPLYFISISLGSPQAPRNERRDASLSYVSPSGSGTADCNDAATYTITQAGQLMSGENLISTTGLVPNAPFAPSPNIEAISTTFSVSDDVLYWNNTAFVGNQALFCQTGLTVDAVFNGELPIGCAQVTLSLLLVTPSSCPSNGTSSSAFGNLPTSASAGTTSVTTSTLLGSPSTSAAGGSSYPGSLSSNGIVADLIGGYVHTSTAPVLAGVDESIMSLEQCLTFCVGYVYFGVSEGILCTCGDSIAAGSTPASYGSCGIPCTGNGSALTTSSTVSVSSTSSTSTLTASSVTTATFYATSTGTPNCLDRSPFAGTINSGYLILCDTALPGYDLSQVNGTDLADCIAACDNYAISSSPQQEPCVAVEYDENASTDACHLKYNIGIVSSGGNAIAQAAILVNQANAPSIVYFTAGSAASSTTAIPSFGSTSTTTTTGTPMAQLSVPTTSSTPVVPPSSLSTILSSFTVATFPMQSPLTGSMSLATSTLLPSSNSVLPSASATALCPGSNHQVYFQGLASYEVECSKQLLGNVLTENTSTVNSLQQCFGFCNLLNLAQPFTCLGVNYLNTVVNPNCLLLSTVTGYTYSPLEDSGRLIYAGYPSVTDATLAVLSTNAASSSSPSSPSALVSSFISTPSTFPSSSVGGTSTLNYPSLSASGLSTTISPPGTAISSTGVSSLIIGSTVASSNVASYSSPTSSVIGQSSTLQSSPTLLSSTITTVTSSSLASTSRPCSATASTSLAPIPSGTLCPGTPGGTVYGVSFSGTGTGSGTPYEIECSTNFAGVLDQPVVALSLQDCINTCQQYKYSKQLPCYAVSFNNSAAALNLPPQNNCNLYANITAVMHGVSQFDSARIVNNSSGYINVNDYCSTSGAAAFSSTTLAPIDTRSPSIPVTSPAGSNAANVPSATTTIGNTASTVTASPGLCPGSNLTIVQDGGYNYEIECGLYYAGHDIGTPPGYTTVVTDLDGCVGQCNYWNDNPSLGDTCIYALYAGPPLNGCYNKDTITGPREQMMGYNIARLINSAYPSPTDLG